MTTYKRQRYLFMTLDPVHIGTGGYRLGRVDNSIVREPGTKIPKIPGTSLHGAARSYAAQLYETPEAAGQDQKGLDDPDNNPICYTFGYIKTSKDGNNDSVTKAYSGVVNIFDANILLFPVHSMIGPVWVSTRERLKDARFTNLPDEPENLETIIVNWDKPDKRLNLGWLMLNVAETKAEIEAPATWKDQPRYQAINKMVIVKDALFSQIVNSNLEVRTSVAIDPETGAADEGALFTYEAIPRATFLTSEVVLDDYRQAFPSQSYLERKKAEIEQKLEEDIREQEKSSLRKDREKIEKSFDHINNLKIESAKHWNCPLCVVKAGFRMIEWLGVGGMGTRGFGRMAMIGDPACYQF